MTVQRDTVPAWAQDAQTTTGERRASQKQLNYIRDLSQKKDLASLSQEQRDALVQPDEFWQEDTTRLSFEKARRMLDLMIPLPNRPRETVISDGVETSTALSGLPPGRYALPKAGTELEDNELRFYQCWESRDKAAKRIYVMFGPSEAKLPIDAQIKIAKMIVKSGIRECAIRYGMEIGSCSNCGRRLTNRISRELGIGPICGGRMFGGDEWSSEVKSKRQEILARGEDPDEEFNDE
jgi:hypothetical protein